MVEKLEIETKNNTYLRENRGDGLVLLSGKSIKMEFIGRSMHLEFRHPTHGVIHTSRIRDIREIPHETLPTEQLAGNHCMLNSFLPLVVEAIEEHFGRTMAPSRL